MVDRDAVRDGYNALAERYAAQRSLDGGEQAILDQFCRPLPLSARVLDAGCGQGEPVLQRLAAEWTAIGIDISQNQIALASEAVPAATLAQAEMSLLPFAAETFDAITAFHSLIHVPLVDHQQVIDEFARLLRPGGRLLVSEGLEEWRGSNPDWLDTGVEMQWEIAGIEQTRKQLRQAGFQVVDQSTAGDELADNESQWIYLTAKLSE